MAHDADPPPATTPSSSTATDPAPAGAPGPLPPARGDRSAGGTTARPTGRLRAAVGGLLAAGVALGVGELVAGLDSRLRSPVEAVATEVIDRVPKPVERFAIETFGSNDKLALVIGILSLSAVFGVLLGLAARRRPVVGTVGMGAFGLLGVARVARDAERHRDRRPAERGRRGRRGAGPAGCSCRPRSPPPNPPLSSAAPLTRGGLGSRRAFLGVAAAAAAGAALAGAGGRALRGRFSAAESRASVTPAPGRGAAAAHPGERRGGRRGRHPVRHPQPRLLPGRHRPASSRRSGPRTGPCR